MANKFTVEAIQEIVKPYGLQVRTVRGNFQAQWDTTTLRGMTDEEKMKNLLRAADRLRKAGYQQVDPKMANPGQDGVWRPWPCLWVNRPDETAEQVKGQLSRVEHLLGGLLEVLSPEQTKALAAKLADEPNPQSQPEQKAEPQEGPVYDQGSEDEEVAW